MSKTKVPDFDINSAFEDIACSEAKIYQEAYDEGFIESQKQSDKLTDAFHSGAVQGAKYGSQLGFFSGFCNTLMRNENPEISAKVLKLCSKTIELIENFPKTNQHEEDLERKFTQIKGNIQCKFH